MGFGFMKKSGKKAAPPPPPPPAPAPEPKPEAKPTPAPPPPAPAAENGHPICRCCPYDMGGDMDYLYAMQRLRSIEMSKNKTYRLHYWDDYDTEDYYYVPRHMGFNYPMNAHGYHRSEVFALPPPPRRAPRRALPPPHSHHPVPYYRQLAASPLPQCHYPLGPPRRPRHFAVPPSPAFNHYAPAHHHDDYYASAVCYYY